MHAVVYFKVAFPFTPIIQFELHYHYNSNWMNCFICLTYQQVFFVRIENVWTTTKESSNFRKPKNGADTLKGLCLRDYSITKVFEY